MTATATATTTSSSCATGVFKGVLAPMELETNSQNDADTMANAISHISTTLDDYDYSELEVGMVKDCRSRCRRAATKEGTTLGTCSNKGFLFKIVFAVIIILGVLVGVSCKSHSSHQVPTSYLDCPNAKVVAPASIDELKHELLDNHHVVPVYALFYINQSREEEKDLSSHDMSVWNDVAADLEEHSVLHQVEFMVVDCPVDTTEAKLENAAGEDEKMNAQLARTSSLCGALGITEYPSVIWFDHGDNLATVALESPMDDFQKDIAKQTALRFLDHFDHPGASDMMPSP